MRNFKYILIFLAFQMLNACIEPYSVEDHVNRIPRMVIDGVISDGCDAQEITISKTSSTEDLSFLPLSNCKVYVHNENDKVWEFVENPEKPGHYIGTIEPQYLLTGSQFKLLVFAPGGGHYESPFETMLPCPAIDTIYHQHEEIPSTDPDKVISGHQFYTNFNATDYFGSYYRYLAVETYEFHSTWPKNDYLDEFDRTINGPVDYSAYICYKTDTVDKIMTLSTESFASNNYNGYKLNFVDNHSQRLMWHYSILLKLQSLSQASYQYWEKLKQNNKSEGGLFTKQPAMIRGNVRNVNDSTEIVLGYFNVVSESTKRIVVDRVDDLTYYDVGLCEAHIIYFELGMDWPDEPRPLYILNAWAPDGEVKPAWGETECFDCTLLGGSLDKPDYFK